jgi:tripartite-type tricarboxylate transporter receptor subunit TctC
VIIRPFAFITALVLLAAAWAQAPAGAVDAYPTRTVTIVVTSAAGGLTDVIARAIGQRLSAAWGQTVVIENKGGAGHSIGATAVAKATPDGYTLMVTEAATVMINPTLYGKGKLPYDAEKDFVPVSGLVSIASGLLARPTLPVKNVAELIALAKQKPGTITYGTAGIGTMPHMSMVMFASMAGIKLQPVHYRGASPALNDVLGGHVDLISMGPTIALPAVHAGKLKMLASSGAHRFKQLPDVPTVAESGLPGYEASTWFGLFAPTGTPNDIIVKLNSEVQHILADPAFREKFLDRQLLEPMSGSPDAFAHYIATEAARWGKVIREQNLTIAN